MNRIVNELTADEVRRGTGVKVGDFGTGGRTYINRYERDPNQRSSNATCAKICFFASILITLGILVSVETSLFATREMLEEALKRAIPVDGPSSVDASLNGKLVFVPVHNTPAIVGTPPEDEFFGLTFASDVAIADRVTEYCQWQENVHTREINEGRDPRTGKDVIRREKEYFYVKGWHSHLINSKFFDNAVAYNNPSRDPAPSRTFHANGGVNIGSASKKLIVAAADFAHALRPAETVTLYKEGVKKLGQNALSEGFNEADYKYVYSRVPEDGFLGSPIVKAGAAYLIDGVVDVNEISRGTGFEHLLAGAGLDWITKGTCKAGDIRVHFETRRVPDTAAVLGMVVADGQKIIPFTYTNGHARVFANGVATDLSGLVKSTNSEESRQTLYIRLGLILLVLIGSFFGAEFYARNSGTLVLSAGLYSLLLGGVWTFVYGVDKLFVSPLLLGAGVAICGYVYKQNSSNNDSSFDNRTGAAQPKPKEE